MVHPDDAMIADLWRDVGDAGIEAINGADPECASNGGYLSYC